jgi:hypothetical protein
MKKNFVVSAIAIVFALTLTASAQKAPADFSGKWTLDLSKSKVSDNEKAAIESQVLTVTQSAADFKVETATKRITPPNAPAGAPEGGRMMGGGGGPMAVTYPMGKETTVEQQRGQMTIPVTSGSKWDGSKLVVWSSSTFNGPNGEMKNSTKEVWELSADGKTLTVARENNGPRGAMSSTRVYTKN